MVNDLRSRHASRSSNGQGIGHGSVAQAAEQAWRAEGLLQLDAPDRGGARVGIRVRVDELALLHGQVEPVVLRHVHSDTDIHVVRLHWRRRAEQPVPRQWRAQAERGSPYRLGGSASTQVGQRSSRSVVAAGDHLAARSPIAEPKTLHYRIVHTAARLARGGRRRCRRCLKIAATWPWTSAITTAWQRIQAIPHPT